MPPNFWKYQGLGNDFILINRLDVGEGVHSHSPDQIRWLCSRHFGIGADGVIYVDLGTNGCSYAVRIFNSDGSEAEMCGNGIRCVAKYIHSKLTSQLISLWTKRGKIVPTVQDEIISINMGSPIFSSACIPSLIEPTLCDAIIESSLEWNSKILTMTCVSMGNPHAVIFVDDIGDVAIDVLGPHLENHSSFPNKTNVEIVQVWERGAGRTLACGTGACAVVVAAVLTGRCDKSCWVTLPGGDLHIEWQLREDSDDSTNHEITEGRRLVTSAQQLLMMTALSGDVIMQGPACEVFCGTLPSVIPALTHANC